jgi:hypothetical protein
VVETQHNWASSPTPLFREYGCLNPFHAVWQSVGRDHRYSACGLFCMFEVLITSVLLPARTLSISFRSEGRSLAQPVTEYIDKARVALLALLDANQYGLMKICKGCALRK